MKNNNFAPSPTLLLSGMCTYDWIYFTLRHPCRCICQPQSSARSRGVKSGIIFEFHWHLLAAIWLLTAPAHDDGKEMKRIDVRPSSPSEKWSLLDGTTSQRPWCGSAPRLWTPFHSQKACLKSQSWSMCCCNFSDLIINSGIQPCLVVGGCGSSHFQSSFARLHLARPFRRGGLGERLFKRMPSISQGPALRIHQFDR